MEKQIDTDIRKLTTPTVDLRFDGRGTLSFTVEVVEKTTRSHYVG